MFPFKDPEEMAAVLDIFRCLPTKFKVEIGRSRGVGGESLVLLIKSINHVALFNYKLCDGLLPLLKTTCTTSTIRFAMCSEDIAIVLQTKKLCGIFCEDDVRTLQDANKSGVIMARRTHALIGQSIMQKFDSVQIGTVTLHFLGDAASLYLGWQHLRKLAEKIIKDMQMPEDFDFWEDDENVSSDDSDYYVFNEDLLTAAVQSVRAP